MSKNVLCDGCSSSSGYCNCVNKPSPIYNIPNQPTTPTTPTNILADVLAILNERGKTHGQYDKNITDIAQRWTRYIHNTKGNVEFAITPVDVAYMMIEMKLSRAQHGNVNEPDHLNDIIGYAAIGGALNANERTK